MQRMIIGLMVAGLQAVALSGMAFSETRSDGSGEALQGKGTSSRPLDELFAEIDRRSPGFGGLFRDKDGRLGVYLLDSSQEKAVGAAIADLLGESVPETGIRVLQAEFTFSELAQWREQLNTVHAFPGVALTDVDEASNRVKIGLESQASRPAVENEIDRLGIPRAAVNIEVTGPFFYATTVQSRIRPVVGGMQVTFDCSAFFCAVCTDGFVAVRAGIRGFVTNSHCSENIGVTDSTRYYQPLPTITGGNRIGIEVSDPPYFTGGDCPPGRQCRYSDSAFVRRSDGSKFRRGLVARPAGPGSTTISNVSPRFRIVAEDPGPLVGDPLVKVGRTSGWTQGTVAGTCMTVDVANSAQTLLCQDAVEAAVLAGDSGSPVFKIAGASDVTLYGLVWGGDSSGTHFVFSRLANIERSDELGPLLTCLPTIGC